MTLPRIDRMTEAPIEGRWYMVPTVRGEWRSEISDWPVVGRLHDDVQFFQFPWKHYHIDGRFLTRRQQRRVGNYGFTKISNFYQRLARACLAYPMQTGEHTNRDGFGKPVYMLALGMLADTPLGQAAINRAARA